MGFTDKSNEVKTGGAVPSMGRIITLKVEDEEDLARDILKVCFILAHTGVFSRL